MEGACNGELHWNQWRGNDGKIIMLGRGGGLHNNARLINSGGRVCYPKRKSLLNCIICTAATGVNFWFMVLIYMSTVGEGGVIWVIWCAVSMYILGVD